MGCIQPALELITGEIDDDFLENERIDSASPLTLYSNDTPECEFKFTDEYSPRIENETEESLSQSSSFSNQQSDDYIAQTTNSDNAYLSDSSDSSDSFLEHALTRKPTLEFQQHAVCDYGWKTIANTKIPKLQTITICDHVNIDLLFLKQFEHHSYINCYELVVDGYIATFSDNIYIPNCINQICGKFYYDEAQHIMQIGYILHEQCMHKFHYETLTMAQIKGVTGNELFHQIKNNFCITETDTNAYCCGLIKYGFVKLVAIRQILAINDHGFHSNDKYLYTFDINQQN